MSITESRCIPMALGLLTVLAVLASLLNPVGLSVEIDEGHYLQWGYAWHSPAEPWYMMKAFPLFLIRSLTAFLGPGMGPFISIKLVFVLPFILLAWATYHWRLGRSDSPLLAFIAAAFVLTVPSVLHLCGRLLSDLWSISFLALGIAAFDWESEDSAGDTWLSCALAFALFWAAYYSRTLSFLAVGGFLAARWVLPVRPGHLPLWRAGWQAALRSPALILGVAWAVSVLAWSRLSSIPAPPFGLAASHIAGIKGSLFGSAVAFTAAFGVLLPVFLIAAVARTVFGGCGPRFYSALLWLALTWTPYLAAAVRSPGSVMPRYAMDGVLPLAELVVALLAAPRAECPSTARKALAAGLACGILVGLWAVHHRMETWVAWYTHRFVIIPPFRYWLLSIMVIGTAVLPWVFGPRSTTRIEPRKATLFVAVLALGVLVANVLLALPYFAVNVATTPPHEFRRLFRQADLRPSDRVILVLPDYEAYFVRYQFPQYLCDIVDPYTKFRLTGPGPLRASNYLVTSERVLIDHPDCLARVIHDNSTGLAPVKIAASGHLTLYQLDSVLK